MSIMQSEGSELTVKDVVTKVYVPAREPGIPLLIWWWLWLLESPISPLLPMSPPATIPLSLGWRSPMTSYHTKITRKSLHFLTFFNLKHSKIHNFEWFLKSFFFCFCQSVGDRNFIFNSDPQPINKINRTSLKFRGILVLLLFQKSKGIHLNISMFGTLLSAF